MLLGKTERLFLVGQNYFKQTIIPSNLDVCGFEFWEIFEGFSFKPYSNVDFLLPFFKVF